MDTDVEGKELPKISFESLKKHLAEIRDFFSKRGIFAPETDQVASGAGESESADGCTAQGLGMFVISKEQAQPAFFLSVNGIDDVLSRLHDFTDGLHSLHDEIASYAESNMGIGEDVRRKITQFNVSVAKASGVMEGNRGKKIEAACREKISVDELRQELGTQLGKLIGEKLMDGVMEPIYEDPRPAYQFIVQKMNEFLAHWGVITIDLKAGEPMDYELPCTVMPDIEDGTDEQHGKIREVHHFPYVWNEARKDPLPVWHGSVSVWR